MFRWIGIGVAVITVLAIAYIVAMAIFEPLREASRDIAIVILAVFQMIGAMLMIALLLAILYAVRTINNLAKNNVVPKIELLTDKIEQVLENTRTITGNVQETTATVTTTTGYVAEQVVAPVIRVSSLLVGVRAAASFLARRGAPPKTD